MTKPEYKLFIIDESDINEEWQIMSHNINNALNRNKSCLTINYKIGVDKAEGKDRTVKAIYDNKERKIIKIIPGENTEDDIYLDCYGSLWKDKDLNDYVTGDKGYSVVEKKDPTEE